VVTSGVTADAFGAAARRRKAAALLDEDPALAEQVAERLRRRGDA
jgi:hypothetical protein